MKISRVGSLMSGRTMASWSRESNSSSEEEIHWASKMHSLKRSWPKRISQPHQRIRERKGLQARTKESKSSPPTRKLPQLSAS